MIEYISNHIADIFIRNKIISSRNRDVYVYGLFLILSTLQTSVVILVVAAILGNVFIGIVFLISMMLPRFFVGGYHANTYFKCFLTSLSLSVVVFIISIETPYRFVNILSIMITSCSSLYIYIHTPLMNQNNPLTDRQIEKYRRISRLEIAIQSIVIFLGTAFLSRYSLYFYTASLTTCVVAILLFLGKIKER